ncbi:glycosyltransferase 61 family protein [Methylovulum sp.]|uniref:glycosyltransferase family 61 protein n=1 Tax=Methylovulum sp. TaxID=1916980 RepID=UPI00261ACC28|nr:glycosyltransferase 61 family protein [Methylovulum sp.]
MPPPKKIAIVGSSHVTWWELAIERRQIPKPSHDVIFIGRGAMPIWGDFIRSEIARIEDQVDQMVLLVGDLRFGNKILKSEKFLRTGDSSGNYLYIEKELISDENDKRMLKLNVNFFNDLSTRLGSKLRILLWSSTYREFLNKQNDRYGGKSNYRHPVWNLADLAGQFKNALIDTSPLTGFPLDSFFLDSNGHPTFKGHALIGRLLAGQDALAAYESVCSTFETWSHLMFPLNADRYRINITGNSIAFRALDKAVRTNCFLMPASWEINGLKASRDAPGRYDRVVYLSGLSFQDESPAQIKAKIAEEKAVIQQLALGGPVTVMFWDQWARETVSKRPEYLNQFMPKHAEAYVEGIEQQFADFDVRRLSAIPFQESIELIECGGSFHPCGKGYAALFHLMISPTLLPTAFSRFEQMLGYCLNPSQADVGANFSKLDSDAADTRLARLQGELDGIGLAGDVCGWAIDVEASEYRVPVYIFSGTELVASVMADKFRADLQYGDGGDGGFYGFSSGPLALSLLKNLHVGMPLRASFDAEGQFELANSPITLSQEAYTKLVLAAIKPWETDYHGPRFPPASCAYRLPLDGSHLYLAKRVALENDPAIFPRTEVVLDRAVVEGVRRPSAYFKAVIRVRTVGGVYRKDGGLEASAMCNRVDGGQIADPFLTTKPTRHIDTVCLYGGTIVDQYGHFIIESLSRFQGFQRYSHLPIVYTYYADATRADELPAYMQAIFELTGIPLERIILVQETTSFKKLVIPKIGMRYYDYLDADHQQAMAAKVKAAMGKEYPDEKQGNVYISRSGLSTEYTGNIICGEAEFENYLKSEGFTVVSPETLTVKEQVKLFCSAQNVVGFIGSGFHTLLLCADVPEKIFYLNRNKAGVNPQYPLIDQVLGIQGHYIDSVIRSSARITQVDFEAVSRTLMASGLVKQLFNAKQHDLETEFALVSDWLNIKHKGKNLSWDDKEHLEVIVDQCLNKVVAKEAQTFLNTHSNRFQISRIGALA